MAKRVIRFILFLLLLWAPLGGSKGDDIGLFSDYASYRGEKGLSQVEIYYSFPREELSFTDDVDGYLAIIDVSAEVTEGERSIWSRNWSFGTKVSSEFEKKEPSTIFDLIRLWLKPGDYSYSLLLRDRISGMEGSVHKSLKVGDFPLGKLQLSDIELAYSIEEGDSTRFYKNGLRVVPYPRSAYGPNYPVLYFYTEAYNLSFSPQSQSDYKLSYSVYDAERRLVKEFPSTFRRKPGPSAVLTGGINVLSLMPGGYFLKLVLKDESTSDSASVSKGFFILPPSRVEEELSEEMAQKRRNEISYLATNKELKTYEGLSLRGKMEFLREFWRLRDPDPLTPENEFKVEYYSRWNYATEHFSSFGREDGWKSDMGRVYIIYGPPDQVERVPFESGQKSWQRWSYFVKDGGYYFIFVDLEGFGRYTLVHSTAKGERNDPNWERFINQ